VIEIIHDILDTDPKTAGSPMGEGKWTHQTAAKISAILGRRFGLKVSATVVRRLLGDLHYSLKSNRKCLSSGNAPGRDEQFGRIAELRREFADAGRPVISVDTKKKELIGLFKNPGRTWRDEALKVKDHDFRSEALGLAVPYGIYDVIHNSGLLVVGQSADTPEFAVNCIVKWWNHCGRNRYPDATKLLVFADSGGSNGASPRAWKKHLQEKLADAAGLAVTVAHYPSGASKWNPIEHRMFSEITKNWAGEPLVDFDTVVNRAAHTDTATGLRIEACRDERTYERGEKVTAAEMDALHLTRGDVLPKWNYTISPRVRSTQPEPDLETMLPKVAATHRAHQTRAAATAKM